MTSGNRNERNHPLARGGAGPQPSTLPVSVGLAFALMGRLNSVGWR
jgi:hypothetical protein